MIRPTQYGYPISDWPSRRTRIGNVQKSVSSAVGIGGALQTGKGPTKREMEKCPVFSRTHLQWSHCRH
jgi:hypothetical protein